MAVGEIYTLQLEGIAMGGAAFGRFGGKLVFIEGGAPDETICCRIAEERGSWAKAELLEIIEVSPFRTGAYCAFYGVCGGCNLQHIEYSAQIAAKTAILKESFIKTGGFCPPEPEIFTSPPLEYRNRMQFHCVRQSTADTYKKPPKYDAPCAIDGHGNKTVSFGLKCRGSGKITTVTNCSVADSGIQEFLQGKRETIRLPPGKDRFNVYSRNGLFLNEGGVERGTTVLLGKEIVLDAGVFFQSNGVMLEKLILQLREIAETADQSLPMADLYSGVGTFAVFLAGMFPKITLVEENKQALALARENLKGTDAEFFACRDTDWLKRNSRHKTAYGFAVVDPPRPGLAQPFTHWLAKNGPALLVYVSCDPVTLARDSKILVNGGYELTKLSLYDFFPQTAHIETLAVFERERFCPC
jgi:23S rRNA (uracil1939-C5)-methyltransferase